MARDGTDMTSTAKHIDTPVLLDLVAAGVSVLIWELVLELENHPPYLQGTVYVGAILSGFVIAGLLWSMVGTGAAAGSVLGNLPRGWDAGLSALGLTCWFGSAALAKLGGVSIERSLAVGAVLLVVCSVAATTYQRISASRERTRTARRTPAN